MAPHPLTSFEIQNELKFNCLFNKYFTKNKGWGICNKS